MESQISRNRADGNGGGHPPRTALIFGGTSGLGLASAIALQKNGSQVAICGRDPSRLDDAVKILGSGGGVLGILADVTSSNDIYRAIHTTVDHFGSVFALIPNGGGPVAGGFFELSDEQWQSAFQLTLMSVVHAVRGVVPVMRDNGCGRIVIIGSSAVKRPIGGLTLSNAFRPGVAGLMKDLALTLAPDAITVNIVAPGRIQTDRIRMLDERRAAREGLSLEDAIQASYRDIPFGRYGTPDEFASVVAFLASEEASYVTGQTILVDGAMVPTLP